MKKPARKEIPWQIKAHLYRKQDGKCVCGRELDLWTPRAVHADHNPALTIRPINEDGTDYDPPQLDPDHIELVNYECCHKEKSKDDTTRGAKTARQGRKHRGEIKPKGRMPKGRKLPKKSDSWVQDVLRRQKNDGQS